MIIVLVRIHQNMFIMFVCMCEDKLYTASTIGRDGCARAYVRLCMYVHVGLLVCKEENEMSVCLHVRIWETVCELMCV
jgi:hypothetical protein